MKSLRAPKSDPNAGSGESDAYYEMRRTTSRKAWSIWAGLAAERRLGVSVLQKLGGSPEEIASWCAAGILIASGEVRPLSIARSGLSEPAYEIAPALRQRVLREAQKRGVLGPVTLQTAELLGQRSEAALVRKVEAGSLVFRDENLGAIAVEVREALCRSVLDPFDADWLEATWGKRVPQVLALVLGHSFDQLYPVTPVIDWLLEEDELRQDPLLYPLLISHALVRLDAPRVAALLENQDHPARLALLTAERFIGGQLALADQLLLGTLSDFGSLTRSLNPLSPLLAVLLAARAEALGLLGNKDPRDFLKGKKPSDSLKSARKALSTFLRHRDQTEAAERRLDVHQLPKNASAWEVLLLGLTVTAFETKETVRAAWAEHLTRWGRSALDAGYLWIGRQGLVLAHQLDNLQMARTLAHSEGGTLPITSEGLTPQVGDLAALFPPRAPWELKLALLERATTVRGAPLKKHRLRWFVDPISGSIGRPGLLSHDSKTGWTLKKRMSWQEARELSEDLGPDDARVLELSELSTESEQFPHLEVFAALVGHPRVVDGARGGLRMEVARAECRIETIEEGEHVRLGVRPAGVGPGLNLVRDGESRLLVVDVEEPMDAVLEALPEDVLVPQADVPRLLTTLGRLGDGIPITGSLFESESEKSADTTPTLRFTTHAGAYWVELGVVPFGPGGRFFATRAGPAVVSKTAGGRNIRVARDFMQEERRKSELIAACPSLLSQPVESDEASQAAAWVLGEERVLQLLGEVRNAGLDCHLEWPEKNAIRLTGSVSVGALRGGLRPHKGWYLLSGSISIDEVTPLTLAQLSRAPFVHGGRYLRLPTGDVAEVDHRVRRIGLLLSGSKLDAAGNVQLSPARLLAVRDALEGTKIQIDAAVEARVHAIKEALSEQRPPPQELTATLRDYQESGYQWLCRLAEAGFGACLADDMGLGKTIQVIAFLLTRPLGCQHLIVAPVSVCINWEREFSKFAATLDVRQFDPSDAFSEVPADAPSRVLIVSYNQLVGSVETLSKVAFDTVVADEAHYVKNPKTQRAQALLSLDAQQRIATTGTPVENHLGDLWGIFRFLNPGLLGPWSAFHAHFVKPIERDDDAIQKENLQSIVRPFLLRRTKSEVLSELPPLTQIRHVVHASEDEAKRYAILRRQIHERLHTRAGRENNKLEVLAEITRLRRFCCHPRLVFPDAPDDSPKLRALIPLVQELAENGHRALIFSQYVDFLASVRQRLNEHEIGHEYLDGSSSRTERQLAVDRFHSGSAPLFVISLKAGGVGLNLTAADYVIHLDPWWNPAVSSQATDRAHRIGQERPVTVYEFMTAGTIEEDIFHLHETKNRLSELVLDGADGVADASQVDLADWLLHSLIERDQSGLAQHTSQA